MVATQSEDLDSQPIVLPWDRFSKWIHCICIVTFDLELGQAIEYVYPKHAVLTEQEKSNVCYLAFPDSNSGCMGDTQFHFRIRHSMPPCHRQQCSPLQSYNTAAPTALQADEGYFFGYVYFRQTKDKSIRRGYFQKSVVLLSKLPLICLFSKIVALIGQDYFTNGEPSLEAACHDIDQWEAPTPGVMHSLPVLGTVIQARIPHCSDKVTGLFAVPKSAQTDGPCHDVLPNVGDCDLFTTLQPVVHHIQMVWELLLTAEPIAVMAPSPTLSSQAVQALVSLIWPMRYCSDYRPFFTIHDSEFKEYTTRTQSPPSAVLGVTNPFFAKSLLHWPHIIRIGGSSSKAAQRVKKMDLLKTLDSKPGVYSTYKPFLSCDKDIIKKLAKGTQTSRPREVQNALLRKFFAELTQSFINPLERYMASLMPLQKCILPHKGTPVMRDFDQEEFLRSLESAGPQLTTGVKGDWAGLYRRFLLSSNFEGWFASKREEVQSKLEALHLEVLCKEDWPRWTQGRQEVEIVDLVLRMKEKLNLIGNGSIVARAELVERLQGHLVRVVASLPEDLQMVLNCST